MNRRILVICYMGRNRSKYLADYLTGKGFIADCAGISPETKNLATQDKIDQSDILIFVMPRIKEKFLRLYKIHKQEIITLDVEDRLDILCPEKDSHSPSEAREVYEEKVYPELIKQITEHMASL
ncbi:MAG: hypothetical protein V1867_00695 [Candidatus Falkowbacteria bacterium]